MQSIIESRKEFRCEVERSKFGYYDQLFESKMNRAVQLTESAYRRTLYREAVKEGFYELQVCVGGGWGGGWVGECVCVCECRWGWGGGCMGVGVCTCMCVCVRACMSVCVHMYWFMYEHNVGDPG